MTRNALKGAAAGIAAGSSVGLIGFFLAQHSSTNGMGVAMFACVPLVAGFATALITTRGDLLIVAGGLSLLASLGILISFGKEGWLCALLAFPLLTVSMAAGAGIGLLFRHFVLRNRRSNETIVGVLLLAPLTILGARTIEAPQMVYPRTERIKSELTVHASAETVWGMIQSLDEIHGPKPWLMYIGLPTPVSCKLEARGVGARRICYFENGSIEETVTEWEPPFRMGLRIDRTRMPGRHWMNFENARYELIPEGDRVTLTRTTIVTSRLHPAWYWRPLERMGVRAEHRYILADVALRLGENAEIRTH